MNLGTNLVLLTGATGWLGRSMLQAILGGLPECELLQDAQPDLTARCFTARGDGRSLPQDLAKIVEVVEGDLRSREDCNRFCAAADGATLFHTAGVIHPRRVSDLYEINVQGTLNLLEAAATEGVRRAVVVSSNSPCGCNPHPDHLFDEDSPYNPYMNYGRSKMQMELAVWELQQRTGLQATVIRSPWFYGPNQPPRQTEFFRMIRDGRMPVVGDGENLRSMAYVDNVCQGLLLASVTSCAIGQTYWVADARPYSMREIIDTVERLLEGEFGQKCVHKRLRLPALVGTIARAADASIQMTGWYNQKVHVLSEMNATIACSIAKARRELNYDPTVSLEEGMRRSIAWCFDTGLLP